MLNMHTKYWTPLQTMSVKHMCYKKKVSIALKLPCDPGKPAVKKKKRTQIIPAKYGER